MPNAMAYDVRCREKKERATDEEGRKRMGEETWVEPDSNRDVLVRVFALFKRY
jgi:hypothetical protein